MSERGRGNLKGAFGNVRQRNKETAGQNGNGSGPQKPSPVRRRKRARTGKRSRPEEYGQANGLVRRGVLERWDMAKADPEVRRTLERELSSAGIEFKAGDPDFGAVCELLLGEWLETVGYPAEPGG